ncbi:MAG: crossover junction endodeoxyribonuclease RuvC [Candidatus Tagabacteria bacterium CG_4_9_14_0_2_um_filter_41_11]|uniref:Crossover junction endodeoxyribonuclease RuvC n=1 Tax=Candidatus Tagabacteria bacterium CG_4_9_14_0_2_um_filter_41_11 TaxID=1975019 RepID=A0A2M8EQL9_9BACT|nr:MAG: crossover junction endodeoxyribonuclease RuvC [Candidatus Tagabacteria bacterium CG_4_9_14_0_2_um_filter_41_11]
MIILGIDPGFSRLGYAIIDADKGNSKVIDCSCFETSPRLEYSKRLVLVADKVKDLILKHRPQFLAIEKVFFTKNQKTAFQIAEVRGILLYLAASSGITTCEYTPLEVKMALCGYGKATKEQVQKMLKALLNIHFLPKEDDASDALAICLTCASCLPRPR